MIFITLLNNLSFMLCHKFLGVVKVWCFYIFYLHNLSFWTVSPLKILNFATFWVFESCTKLIFFSFMTLWVLLEFDFFSTSHSVTLYCHQKNLSFFSFCHNFCNNLKCWVLSLFELLSFVTIWVFLVMSQLQFLSFFKLNLSFVTVWFF